MTAQIDLLLKNSGNSKQPKPRQWDVFPAIGSPQNTTVDFRDIKGQFEAKRCLEIAAAGFHHTMLKGRFIKSWNETSIE
jgi:predicted ATPase with chaperone activity